MKHFPFFIIFLTVFTRPTAATTLANRPVLDTAIASLGYPAAVADSVASMVLGWRNKEDVPLFNIWYGRLQEERGRYGASARTAVLEHKTLTMLFGLLGLEVAGGWQWELDEVHADRQANCVGYAQLVHVLGSLLGLGVRTAIVYTLSDGTVLVDEGHVCSVLRLSDARMVLLDMVYPRITDPFVPDEAYRPEGGRLTVTDTLGTTGLHRRIRLAGTDALVGFRHYNAGCVHQLRNQTGAAMESFAASLREYPRNADAFNRLGALYAQLGSVRKAAECYSRAVTVDPDHAGALNNLGAHLLRAGQPDSALVFFNRALAVHPERAELHYNVGSIHNNAGRTDSALACYKRAVRFDPRLAEAYNSIGAIHFERGAVDSAEHYFRETIDRSRHHVQAHLNLGIVLAQRKDFKNSSRYLVRAALIDSTALPAAREIAREYGNTEFRN